MDGDRDGRSRLCPTSADAVSPWRFLHANLVPHPAHVASFTAGLLRGEDLGTSYPANFRAAGGDLTAVASQLTRGGPHDDTETTHECR